MDRFDAIVDATGVDGACDFTPTFSSFLASNVAKPTGN
jgi:hypothetical protein